MGKQIQMLISKVVHQFPHTCKLFYLILLFIGKTRLGVNQNSRVFSNFRKIAFFGKKNTDSFKISDRTKGASTGCSAIAPLASTPLLCIAFSCNQLFVEIKQTNKYPKIVVLVSC